ncbi:hypothetical protein SAMN05661080_03261 [Modestobacter sp. DSM 44400]|uniref:hypothetical protein n=1 Tax=Modestobacter sp. DSM 44400 TaxID=1550230 RepID=UPI000897884D|nr:hypothetical protein [Modestobacter sp. DSM 44400]SDY37284.1 hypothetical protein SAMN05661080_03261 [Modestobacter sp. DSM 44400]
MSASDEHPEVPDTAMATGNDEGEPGEQRASGPLSADEQQLLEQLETPDDTPAAPAVEDSPEAAAAADDDAPLPPAEGAGEGEGDELTPEFTDR